MPRIQDITYSASDLSVYNIDWSTPQFVLTTNPTEHCQIERVSRNKNDLLLDGCIPFRCIKCSSFDFEIIYRRSEDNSKTFFIVCKECGKRQREVL